MFYTLSVAMLGRLPLADWNLIGSIKNESRKAELISQTLTDFNNVISDFAECQGASWDLWIVSAPRDKSNGCCFPPLRVYFGTVSVYKESGSHEAQMLAQNNSSRFRRLIK